MEILNKEEIESVAKDIFNRYPKAKKIAVTEDGQAFIIDEGDNAAINHSRRNVSKKELSITYFTRDSKDETVVETVDNLLNAISEATKTEDVEAIEKTENNGPKRKKVLEAVSRKLSELKKAQ